MLLQTVLEIIQPKLVPLSLWILIGSIIGGLLLLALIIIFLWKVRAKLQGSAGVAQAGSHNAQSPICACGETSRCKTPRTVPLKAGGRGIKPLNGKSLTLCSKAESMSLWRTDPQGRVLSHLSPTHPPASLPLTLKGGPQMFKKLQVTHLDFQRHQYKKSQWTPILESNLRAQERCSLFS